MTEPIQEVEVVKRGRKKEPPIRVTCYQAARELGVSLETLRRNLKEIGEETKGGSKFALHTIYRALTSDGKDARNRQARADAEVAEIELRKLKEELVEVAAMEKRITDIMQPIRQRFMSLPAEACARCNPSDPELARKALDDWTAEALKTIRTEFKKTK